MKLHAGTHTLEKSGTFEESKFSIEASSKAFFILSDGLYSNKILAVVRELSTNAYDSHVDAGNASIPFDVHLPTAVEPVFFIRDYGTSMSHEDCMQLYTTYFRSTRNNSNDAVGCLGLGSKAPFAYADSFTVDAYLNGERRIYSAYKDENGSPVFSLMETVPTDEKNGIKVSINVKNHDVNRFIIEAIKVYAFFKVKPNFIGKPIEYNKEVKLIEGENWFFDDHGHENFIIMGQIAYPIDGNQLGDSEETKYSKFINNSTGLRIFVNIGDVDITPSRESLSYSNQTKINIKSYIDSVVNDISTKIQNEIKNQPTLFAARKKYVQINDQCYSIKNAMESLRKSITWNGQKIFDNLIDESIDVDKSFGIKCVQKSSWRKKVACSDDVKAITFSDSSKFYIDDLPRGGIGRIRNWAKENSNYNFRGYIYKLSYGETIESCKFYELLGNATKEDVVFTSSLPRVEYARNSTSSSGQAIQAMVFNNEIGNFEDCSMSVKYENAFYFTESKGQVFFKNGSKCDIHLVIQALNMIYEHFSDDVEDKNFYILKPSVVKNRSIQTRPNWHNAERFVSEKINELIKKNKQNIYNWRYATDINSSRMSRWVHIFKMIENENVVKNLLVEYNEFAKRIESQRSEMKALYTLGEYLPHIDTIDYEDESIIRNDYRDKFEDCVEKNYPLLKIMNVPWDDNDKKLVLDYIAMTDRNNINS